MKNSIFKKQVIFIVGTIFISLLFSTSACQEESVKLTANDRIAIDTLSTNAINKLTVELDKQCKDSSDMLRKRLVDSLVAVREREIIMQTLPNH